MKIIYAISKKQQAMKFSVIAILQPIAAISP